MQGLASLRGQLVELVSQGVRRALADLKLSYSVLWDEPDARARGVRERLVKTLEIAHVEGRNADLALRTALGEALPKLMIDDPDGEIEELEAAPKAAAEVVDLQDCDSDDEGEDVPPPPARLIAVKAERI